MGEGEDVLMCSDVFDARMKVERLRREALLRLLLARRMNDSNECGRRQRRDVKNDWENEEEARYY